MRVDTCMAPGKQANGYKQFSAAFLMKTQQEIKHYETLKIISPRSPLLVEGHAERKGNSYALHMQSGNTFIHLDN